MKDSLYKLVLSKQSLDLLSTINSIEDYDNFYLAGGTSLALQIGHRKSIDLDFFSPQEFKSSIIHSFGQKYEITSLHDNSIELTSKNTRLFFFFFAFPLYKKIVVKENIRLAHPIDIGLMKLLALQGRTAKKDIIDLYFLNKYIIRLGALLKIFEKHYPKESFNSYDSLKTLLDPAVLETQPMPVMLKKCTWKKCYDLVKEKVSNHIKMIVL
ncbi:MAG: nucleotidyl transferase AbiEii/AbiGii toxin family protein [Patescibacteria group bacterium]|nr:nucleotidyl transferase AbiEii/AbiGii toxin family protein [Patescibacteria group bacterium]